MECSDRGALQRKGRLLLLCRDNVSVPVAWYVVEGLLFNKRKDLVHPAARLGRADAHFFVADMPRTPSAAREGFVHTFMIEPANAYLTEMILALASPSSFSGCMNSGQQKRR